MPDPSWTQEYFYNQTPEQNGFTQKLYGDPVVTQVTSGNPANRRVEINSDNGDAVFLTSQVPSFDSSLGATGELQVAVTGSGDAGFEITFLNTVILVNIFESLANFYAPTGDDGTPGFNLEVATPSNAAATLFRVVVNGSRQASLWRDGVEIFPPQSIPNITKPFQRFLWWGEGGGTQIFNLKRYYIGGGVIPG